MREGEVAYPTPGEKVICIRSGLSGGPFIFELHLEPGAGRPPTHTHEAEDEIVEVLEGKVVFRVNGVERRLRAGDTLRLTPTDAHTFWNPSKTQVMRARVTAGPRFERLVAQPSLVAKMMYLVYVDPGASRLTHPVMKRVARIMAWFGRLRGVSLVSAGEPACPSTEVQP